jgi:Rrf2 family protein
MKLSVRGEYALRALVALGRDYRKVNSVLSTQEIADANNIPKRFLEQILNDLKSIGIVESRRGVAGGYRLRRAPEEVTLAEVIRHLEGPLAPVSCVSERFYEPCSCPNEQRCAIRSVMKEVRDAIVNVLDHVTLDTLCQRAVDLERTASDTAEYVI